MQFAKKQDEQPKDRNRDSMFGTMMMNRGESDFD